MDEFSMSKFASKSDLLEAKVANLEGRLHAIRKLLDMSPLTMTKLPDGDMVRVYTVLESSIEELLP